jgi:RNA polymerase sigma factor (sigma-70 family)
MSIFHQQVLPVRHKLYRFALRITGSVQEAEEEEQATVIQNWEAWCMTLTRNRSLDKTRSRMLRRTTALDGVPESRAAADNPAQHTEYRDLVDQVRVVMQELPEKQRLVMHLRDVEEMSYEEIAQALDINVDQVKVNLHRARKVVRAAMVGVRG